MIEWKHAAGRLVILSSTPVEIMAQCIAWHANRLVQIAC